MTEFSTVLWWSLGGVAVFVGGFLLYLEYGAMQLRTRVQPVPGGLRFVAHDFSVESLTSARELKVKAGKNARYHREHKVLGETEDKIAPLNVTLPLAGLRIEVMRLSLKSPEEGAAPAATGFSRILITSSDELLNTLQGRPPGARTELRLDRVHDRIAEDFNRFANGVHFAVEKVEKQLLAQAEAEAALPPPPSAEDLAAAAEADAAAQAPIDPKARAEEQLAQWRAAAGFTGTHTDYALDEVGKIAWLIDLDPAGRVILHANQRSFYGSLRGASVTVLASDMEVSVRDAYWTKEDPRLVAFRIMAGKPMDEQRAWKQRLGKAIDSLGVER